MLFGSSRPCPWLILEEHGHYNDDDMMIFFTFIYPCKEKAASHQASTTNLHANDLSIYKMNSICTTTIHGKLVKEAKKLKINKSSSFKTYILSR